MLVLINNLEAFVSLRARALLENLLSQLQARLFSIRSGKNPGDRRKSRADSIRIEINQSPTLWNGGVIIPAACQEQESYGYMYIFPWHESGFLTSWRGKRRPSKQISVNDHALVISPMKVPNWLLSAEPYCARSKVKYRQEAYPDNMKNTKV